MKKRNFATFSSVIFALLFSCSYSFSEELDFSRYTPPLNKGHMYEFLMSDFYEARVRNNYSSEFIRKSVERDLGRLPLKPDWIEASLSKPIYKYYLIETMKNQPCNEFANSLEILSYAGREYNVIDPLLIRKIENCLADENIADINPEILHFIENRFYTMNNFSDNIATTANCDELNRSFDLSQDKYEEIYESKRIESKCSLLNEEVYDVLATDKHPIAEMLFEWLSQNPIPEYKESVVKYITTSLSISDSSRSLLSKYFLNLGLPDSKDYIIKLAEDAVDQKTKYGILKDSFFSGVIAYLPALIEAGGDDISKNPNDITGILAETCDTAILEYITRKIPDLNANEGLNIVHGMVFCNYKGAYDVLASLIDKVEVYYKLQVVEMLVFTQDDRVGDLLVDQLQTTENAYYKRLLFDKLSEVPFTDRIRKHMMKTVKEGTLTDRIKALRILKKRLPDCEEDIFDEIFPNINTQCSMENTAGKEEVEKSDLWASIEKEFSETDISDMKKLLFEASCDEMNIEERRTKLEQDKTKSMNKEEQLKAAEYYREAGIDHLITVECHVSQRNGEFSLTPFSNEDAFWLIEDELEFSLALNPKDPLTMAYMARALNYIYCNWTKVMEKLIPAYNLAENAAKIAPDSAEPLYSSGNLFKCKVMNDLASNYYRRALEKDPRHARAYKNLVSCENYSEDTPEEIALLEEILKSIPERDDYLIPSLEERMETLRKKLAEEEK